MPGSISVAGHDILFRLVLVPARAHVATLDQMEDSQCCRSESHSYSTLWPRIYPVVSFIQKLYKAFFPVSNAVGNKNPTITLVYRIPTFTENLKRLRKIRSTFSVILSERHHPQLAIPSGKLLQESAHNWLFPSVQCAQSRRRLKVLKPTHPSQWPRFRQSFQKMQRLGY